MITKLLEFVFRLFIALGCLLCVAFASALMVGIAAVVVILPVYAVWKWGLTPWIGYPLAVLNCFFYSCLCRPEWKTQRNGRRRISIMIEGSPKRVGTRKEVDRRQSQVQSQTR